ncbi:hypothetical protein FA95DRAFT_1614185 [Auriscalpium vulgare]|uniref:Uncharacterized protein n=1 Tax=Auriscalpium vulgare TaxID=40419 RepID=A0ACB8R008_9AGAM|nr:hypothetical protein FA95DRAFT_1614185 [Auriscalpium vulgare]
MFGMMVDAHGEAVDDMDVVLEENAKLNAKITRDLLNIQDQLKEMDAHIIELYKRRGRALPSWYKVTEVLEIYYP